MQYITRLRHFVTGPNLSKCHVYLQVHLPVVTESVTKTADPASTLQPFPYLPSSSNRPIDMATTAHCQPEDREWTENRRFEPYSRYGDNIELDLIQVLNRDKKDWVYMACEDSHPCRFCDCIAPHIDSIFIAVDGACRANGTPDAKAAVGIYVAESSPFNQSLLLHQTPVTNQIAELSAGIIALEQAIKYCRLKRWVRTLLPSYIYRLELDTKHIIKLISKV